jgi:ABC-type sugar transport system substrate-binding protein
MVALRFSGAVLFLVCLVAAPSAAEAQGAAKVYRLGILQPSPNSPAVNYTEALRQGLRDHGYVEGQNIVIELRRSRAPKENPALLADLLGRKIDILVTWTTPALVTAKKARARYQSWVSVATQFARAWSRACRAQVAT